MTNVPGGTDGAPEPGKDMSQGKPPPVGYGQAPQADWRQYARFTMWTLVVVFAVVFLVANSTPVQVNFLFATAEVALYVALGLALLLGVIIGAASTWVLTRRRAKRRRADIKK